MDQPVIKIEIEIKLKPSNDFESLPFVHNK